jgi:AsmA-like protein
LSNIRLGGLEINVPPGGLSLNDDEPNAPSKSDQADQSTDADANDSETSPLIVRNLQSERAVLRILRRKPGKTPRVFEIGQLDMTDIGADHPWPFRANLTNPTPPGRIQTEGTFGPWQAEEPTQTPLAASYRFENADLGVFDGIAGILNSSGAFKGVLERIEVDGTTRMPAFALADVGNGMPLETRFHSIVDGTNGNTLLQPVEATLGATKIHATGGVVERAGEDGRTVELDVVIDAGRLEDILRLAVKGPQPPMTGVMKLRTKFLLPPGDRDAIRKLRLDVNFSVDKAEFTKVQVQDKVDAFSTKARGVKDDTPDPVVSNFRGTFKMRDGAIHFSNVTFAMPGARVSVSGRFLMESEALDFRGIVRLDAKLSQLTTGVKSFFLRIVDGLLRHDDITVVPITIRGTADQPKVGLDFGKAIKGG